MNKVQKNLFKSISYDSGVQEVREYLKYGGDINLEDNKGRTLLMYAVKADNFELVKELVHSFANLNKIDEKGNTALIYSIYADVKISKEIAIYMNDLEHKNNEGYTALTLACLLNKIEHIEFLANMKADLNRIDGFGNTPLCLAIYNESLDVMKLLLKHGVDLECTSGKLKETPLMYAVKQNNIEIVKELLKYNPNVNHGNYCKETPLMYAVDNENIEMVKLLLSANANISLKDSTGNCALSNAVKKENMQIVKLLINSVKLDTLKNELATIALETALRECEYPMVKQLLDYKEELYNTYSINKVQTF